MQQIILYVELKSDDECFRTACVDLCLYASAR